MSKCYRYAKPLPTATKPIGHWVFKGRLYLCFPECSCAYHQRKAEVAATIARHDPFSR